MQEIDPPDSVDLIRLIWHPDDIDSDGNPTSSAFPKDELKGTDKYVSVDRSDWHVEAGMAEIARKQQSKANASTIVRDTANRAFIPCSSVRLAKDDAGNNPFYVKGKAEGFYKAHCGLLNVSGNRNKSYVNRLRALLLPLIRQVKILDLGTK